MDIYKGPLTIENICSDIEKSLKNDDHLTEHTFHEWIGDDAVSFRIMTLSDDSEWTLKYHTGNYRYVHIFPVRYSQHTFRVKSNTLKSALLYLILIGKDMVTADDLNRIRPLLGLSPVKDIVDSEAIMEMIEILRS